MLNQEKRKRNGLEKYEKFLGTEKSRNPQISCSFLLCQSTNQRDSGQRFDEFGRDLRPELQRDSSEEKDKAGSQRKEREQSPPRRKSPSERRGSRLERSPVRRGTRSPEKKDKEGSPSEGKPKDSRSTERDSPSPKRKDSQDRQSKSPDRRRRRSRSRDRGGSSERKSPERYRRKDYRRSPPRDSRDRRASGDYSRRHDRDRDRDRNRGRDRGRNNRGRDWGRDRWQDRDRDRNRDRDRDRDRSEEKATSPSHEKKMFVKASSTGLETLPRPARPPTSEEVQAKLAAHAESLRKQAQDAASMLNLPSYINPSVVNPHQYAVQAQKRKLLWSGKKTAESSTSSSSDAAKSTLWNSTTFSNDQGGEMQAKFRRLMGIKDGGGNAPTEQDGSQPQSQQLMDDLEKEFERSRAFQLSRGAGGKSGIGLGYSGT
ncbi:hypothetical protein ACROYT_G009245 [Oculina patagonica]